MTVRSLMPGLFPDAARLVLSCRHRLEVPSRKQLSLRADGWYASVWCPMCRGDREVIVLIFGWGR